MGARGWVAWVVVLAACGGKSPSQGLPAIARTQSPPPGGHPLPPAPVFSPGDLPLLTAADVPPTPQMHAVCGSELASLPSAGKGARACRERRLNNSAGIDQITLVERSFSGPQVATVKEQGWISGRWPGYFVTQTDNSYLPDGRLTLVIERSATFPSPADQASTTWEETLYDYPSPREFSTSTFYARRDPNFAPRPPALLRFARFVIDARGTSIPVVEDAVAAGREKDTMVTFHPNGVVATESASWDDRNTARTEQVLFDEWGRMQEDDSTSVRSGNGSVLTKITSSYNEAGDLDQRILVMSHQSDWPGHPLINRYTVVEQLHYDGGRLAARESLQTDEFCVIDGTGSQQFVDASCPATPGPIRHTAYRYDARGHLVERTTTDGKGVVLQHWSGTVDADGNLRCELQTSVGDDGLSKLDFALYDYDCAAPSL